MHLLRPLQELLQRAVYVWALYESALNSALEDCLAATLLRPDFAQVLAAVGLFGDSDCAITTAQ
jgi:hypothetical protein